MAYIFGCFARLGDLLKKCSCAEEEFWSNLRSTGYVGLDLQGGILRPGELVVIASQREWMLPPLNLQIIETVAIKEKRPVLHIRIGHDIRLSIGSWLKRKQAYAGWRNFRHNKQAPDLDRMKEIIEAPIYMLDAHGYCMNGLEISIASFAKDSEPLGLIVVEGIDRLEVWLDQPDMSQDARWAFVSSELKRIARDYDCPVVVNSRVRTGADSAQADLSDLVHGGALASSSDLVLVLETTNEVALGKPVDLYCIYTRHDLWPRAQLRYEYETDRWLEIIAN